MRDRTERARNYQGSEDRLGYPYSYYRTGVSTAYRHTTAATARSRTPRVYQKAGVGVKPVSTAARALSRTCGPIGLLAIRTALPLRCHDARAEGSGAGRSARAKLSKSPARFPKAPAGSNVEPRRDPG